MHNTVSSDRATHALQIVTSNTDELASPSCRSLNENITKNGEKSDMDTVTHIPIDKRARKYTVNKIVRHVGSEDNIKHVIR